MREGGRHPPVMTSSPSWSSGSTPSTNPLGPFVGALMWRRMVHCHCRENRRSLCLLAPAMGLEIRKKMNEENTKWRGWCTGQDAIKSNMRNAYRQWNKSSVVKKMMTSSDTVKINLQSFGRKTNRWGHFIYGENTVKKWKVPGKSWCASPSLNMFSSLGRFII